MKEKTPTMEEWRKLYAAAGEFRQIECWEWMDDTDIFCVKDPVSGEIGYCCVLGASGKIFSLIVYTGEEGVRSYLRIQSKESPFQIDDALLQKCLTAEFLDRKYLTEQEKARAKKVLYKCKGPYCWPRFLNYAPAYEPEQINSKQAGFLTHALKQAKNVALRFQKDNTLLSSKDGKTLLIRVQKEEDETLTWKDERFKPQITEPCAPDKIHVDEVRLARIRKNIFHRSGVWEIEYLLGPGVIAEKGKRAYFPYFLLCTEHKDGYIVGFHLASPKSYREEFPHQLMSFIEKEGVIPEKIMAYRKETIQMLTPAALKLKIPIEQSADLDAYTHVVHDLLDFFENHKPEDISKMSEEFFRSFKPNDVSRLLSDFEDDEDLDDLSDLPYDFEDDTDLETFPDLSDTPIDDLLGLTSNEMAHLLNNPFDPDLSPITLNPKINEELIKEVKFYKDTITYLNKLREQEPLKLTQKGNLPRRFCRELVEFGLTDEEWWLKEKKVSSEDNTTHLHLIHIITTMANLTQKSQGRISLTKRCANYLDKKPDSELFRYIFETYVKKFNWGYEDNYPEAIIIQKAFGFSILLLQKFGKMERITDFYGDLFLRAFPYLRDEFPMNFYHSTEESFKGCYTVRTLSRFLRRFGLISTSKVRVGYQEIIRVRKTPLADDLILWKRPLQDYSFE